MNGNDQSTETPSVSSTAPAPVEAPVPELTLTPPESVDPEAPYGRKADGTPRAKPGRKGGTGENDGQVQRERLASVTPRPPRIKPAATMAAAAPIATDYRAMAAQCAGAWYGVGSLVFGRDWLPTDEAEDAAVREAFAEYLKANGVQKVDPNLGLALVLGGYAMQRVATKQTVRDKLLKGWQWVRAKFVRL